MRCHNIHVSGICFKTTFILKTTKVYEHFCCIEINTRMKGYPEKLRILHNFAEAIPGWNVFSSVSKAKCFHPVLMDISDGTGSVRNFRKIDRSGSVRFKEFSDRFGSIRKKHKSITSLMDIELDIFFVIRRGFKNFNSQRMPSNFWYPLLTIS